MAVILWLERKELSRVRMKEEIKGYHEVFYSSGEV